MQKNSFHVKIKQLSRSREIFGIISKYGLADLLSNNIVLKQALTLNKSNHIYALSKNERIRLAIEELGPTFIKFGQILANRNDLFDADLCFELEKLQDKVKPFPNSEALALIEKELRKPTSEVFLEILPDHIGAASIAQVYRATLINGEEVVIKVRRPGIELTIEADLQLLEVIVRYAEKYDPDLRAANFQGMLVEFKKSILQEIDLHIERNNLELFSDFFHAEPGIHVPKSYPALSTHKILTMEFVDGIKLSHLERLRNAGFDTVALASKGCGLFFAQIFRYGFFHGDPHPGNIFVLDNGKICFIDFGIMGHISQRNLHNLASFMIGYVKKDARMMSDAILEICNARDSEHRMELIESMDQFLFESQRVTLQEVKIGDFMQECMEVVNRFNITIPSSLYILGKSLITIQSLATILNPNFNINTEILPYAEELIMKRYSAKGLANEVIETYKEYQEMLYNVPRDTADIIHKIKEGKLKLEHELAGVESFTKKVDVLGKRLSGSIIVAALIIGSVNLAKTGNFEYLTEATFGIGVLAGIYLLLDVLRG